MVKTLLDRAEAIPSNANKRKSEKENVLKDLKINGYTVRFIEMHVKQNRTVKTKHRSREATRAYHMLKVFQKG